MSGGVSRRPGAATALFGAGVGLAVVGNVLAQVAVAHSPYRPQLGYLVFDAGAGIAYAACAALVWRLSARRTPAVLMVAVSLSWCAGTLGLALQTRHWTWVVASGLQGWADPLVAWIALAYPRGRLGNVFSRAVVAGLVALYTARSLLRVLVVDAGTWGWCDCVPNPLAVDADPELVATLEGVVGQWIHAVLFLLALGAVLVRWARSSAPLRRVGFLMPVAFALFCGVAFLFDAATLLGLEVAGVDTQFLWPAVLAGVPLAYVGGLLHLREMRGRVVDLVSAAGGGMDRGAWEVALRSALADPRLRVLWWDEAGQGYRDEAGRPADPDVGGGRLSRLPVGAEGRPVAVVLHDPALEESRPLLESLAAALRLAADNDRLTRDLRESLRQVQQSRARLVEAGDAARRRIERDLHDGSQQFLVSVAMSLRALTVQARNRGDAEVAAQLAEVSDRLADALAQLRELARGIHPSVLTEGGLDPALRELAAQSPLPVDVELDVAVPPEHVGSATAYFAVAEALTNAAKHSGAARCRVAARGDAGRLVLTVEDDGVGGADPRGSGLRGIADRVEAVGGRLVVESTRGRGTRVLIVVPTSADGPVLRAPVGPGPQRPVAVASGSPAAAP